MTTTTHCLPSVTIANAINIVTDLVKTICSEGKDETLSTHHVFCTATGGISYVDKNAVQSELEILSLSTKSISDRCKNGAKGSIVKTDYNVHGVNYTSVTPTEACAMYIANNDSVRLQRFKKPIMLSSLMGANKAAAVKWVVQKYIKREIVKSDSQFNKNNRALWKIDGQGGAGNRTGMGPYVIAYACIIHNPSADADGRYPGTSLWSRTLPVDGLIFENDVKSSGLHYKDAAIAATENHKKQRNGSDEDSKPAAIAEQSEGEMLDSDTETEPIHKKQRKI